MFAAAVTNAIDRFCEVINPGQGVKSITRLPDGGAHVEKSAAMGRTETLGSRVAAELQVAKLRLPGASLPNFNGSIED